MVLRDIPYSQFQSPPVAARVPATSIAQGTAGKVDGSPAVDIALRKTAAGRLSLHLLNRTGAPLPDRFNFTDHVPEIGPISVRLRAAAQPKSLKVVPEDRFVRWYWQDGWIRAELPKLAVHSVLVID